MNSVNESLYYGVPIILYPQHSEELAVTNRVIELGAGIRLKRQSTNSIYDTVMEVLNNTSYKNNAQKISQGLKSSGGAKSGADFIESIINR